MMSTIIAATGGFLVGMIIGGLVMLFCIELRAGAAAWGYGDIPEEADYEALTEEEYEALADDEYEDLTEEEYEALTEEEWSVIDEICAGKLDD